jgi:predicted MFS family arabinose efflux permease
VTATAAPKAPTLPVRDYVLVTAGYWAFTLTDGALRMLVLLHFHELGFSPIALAFMFLLYETMGIVTNLLGGWVGSRTGLNKTLTGGLALQIVALLALTLQDASWASGRRSRTSWACRRSRALRRTSPR